MKKRTQRAHSRPRGTIILTALFLVIVMFGLVSATVIKVRFVQGMTKDQVDKAQAVYLAKAGLNLGLARLNNGESIPTGVPKSFPLGDDSVEIVQEPQAGTDLVYLVATAKTPKHTHTARLVVRVEEGDFEGAVFARGSRTGSIFVPDDKTDSLYIKEGSGSTWSSLEPPPRVRYAVDPLDPSKYTETTDPAKYPENLQNLEATENGQLFATYKRDGGELDTVYKYDLSTKTWGHLLPTPTYNFDAAGNPTSQRTDYSEDLESMASNGDSDLYVKGKSSAKDHDVIYHYSIKDDKWEEPLPRPQNFTLDAKGNVTGTSGFVKDLKHLSVDGDGNVYAVQDRTTFAGTKGTILKFDGTAWKPVPPPDKVVFSGDSFTPIKVAGYADHINQIAVNQSGEIFARGVNPSSSPDTLYHFTNGGWSVIPPPRQVDFHQSGSKFIDNTPAKDYSDMTVDSEGKLYLREHRENKGSKIRFDTVYVYTEGEFSYLPRPKGEFFQGGSLVPDTGTAAAGYLQPDITDVTGGSHPIADSKRYVPTAEF
jgi:hypothetical protein